jgi:hypothetical protein
MFEHLRAYVARPTVFLAAGIAIGALLAPAFGGSGAQGLTTYTRAVSCHALSWQPISSDTHYEAVGTELVAMDPGYPSYFRCNPNLPHKSVVTRVRFTLYDSSIGIVSGCGMVRAALTASTAAASAQVMAVVGTTTNIGYQRLVDTSINFATVDNTNYGYYLQCLIFASGFTDEGIYGADITYKITAANG